MFDWTAPVFEWRNLKPAAGTPLQKRQKRRKEALRSAGELTWSKASVFDWRVTAFDWKVPVFDWKEPVFDWRVPVFDWKVPVFD